LKHTTIAHDASTPFIDKDIHIKEAIQKNYSQISEKIIIN